MNDCDEARRRLHPPPRLHDHAHRAFGRARVVLVPHSSASICFPNVDFPIVTVTTTLTGASVEEMETSVTKPIEEAINTIEGIDELQLDDAGRASRPSSCSFVLEK